MKPGEAVFESHIAEWLVDHGDYTAWKLGTQSTDFDPARGLDTVELFAFIEETQPDEWAKVLTTHGGGSVAAEKAFLDRLTNVPPRGLASPGRAVGELANMPNVLQCSTCLRLESAH